MRFDDYNYYADRRLKVAPEVEPGKPYVWEICGVCSGEGKVVNPSIDAGGINPEVFADDPDFYEDYMSGRFDIPCNYCGGSGKVKVLDVDKLSDEEREDYYADLEAERSFEAERLAEIRAGC